nr:E3 ubiquitin-protein ligase UPL1-like [Tanacetum cinerariifolium]
MNPSVNQPSTEYLLKLCANVDSNVNIDHIQVHGQLGIAEGLIGMAIEPIERVNTHNFLGVGTPLGSDRRHQQNRTSIETSDTEGNGFQHPLLSRPSLSDKVYTLARELLKKLASIVPSHRKLFIVELSDFAFVKANVGDPPLPLGTQRLLPFIEAFMVLCDKLEEKRSLLQEDNACATESKIKQSITNPGLLEKSLSILLKARNLMDFDNKRSYFRSRIRKQHEQLLAGQLRVAKALFDGQLLDVYFTRSFYKHILGFKVTYHNIEVVDPDYYKNLKWMLENDVSDIPDLTFNMDADEEKHILYEKTKANTEYSGYTAASNAITWVWGVVKAFKKEDRARYIQRGQPDADFPLFESESLMWPGSVEFDNFNGKVLTYSAPDSVCCIVVGLVSGCALRVGFIFSEAVYLGF